MAVDGSERRDEALFVRVKAAALDYERPRPLHVRNDDETIWSDYAGAYSKGLQHVTTGSKAGEVVPDAYDSLLAAVENDDPDVWNNVQLAAPPVLAPPPPLPTPLEIASPYAPPLPRRLKNPLAGLAYDLQGPDVSALTMKPAPEVNSDEAASEMAEAYWMALLRDVPFLEYTYAGPVSNPPANSVADAVASLNSFSNYTGPGGTGGVTAQNLFRGTLPGDEVGPYISQFLLRGVNATSLGLEAKQGRITFGNMEISQKRHTVSKKDFLTDPVHWLGVQDRAVPIDGLEVDNTQRFIRNGRDLAHVVRSDRAYQHYLNACLILQNIDPHTIQLPDRSPHRGTDAGNPYGPAAPADPNSVLRTTTQEGFATFGDWHVLTLLAEVSTRALQAAWYHKWYVHRRLRPEEFAGRVHQRQNGGPQYVIHPDLLGTISAGGILARIAAKNGSNNYLLPQAFPEGAPTHPAYPSGHAVLAGACVTVLKAHFDETLEFGPEETNPAKRGRLGTVLAPRAPRAGIRLEEENPQVVLTVGGELNKLASNVSLGRNFGGVHWRSDYREGINLGEKVAIGLLQEQSIRYHENRSTVFDPSYTFTRFNGDKIQVEDGKILDGSGNPYSMMW